MLFFGPPGLGKTSISHIIAKEMETNIKITAAPMIEKSGDLAAILTNLQAKDILLLMKSTGLAQRLKRFYTRLWKILDWILS